MNSTSQRVKWAVSILLILANAGCDQSVGRSIEPQVASLDDAFSACNRSASPPCNLTIPPGKFTFSVQLSPLAMFSIQGAGASNNNPGISTTQNIERHCLTTLIWTGGGRTPFLISSHHLQGSKLAGFCIDAVGAPPETFIEVDKFAGDVTLDDVVIDTPRTPATIAAIRYGNSGAVVDPVCNNVFVRAAAPIGFDILDVQAHFVGNHCRAVWNGEHEWVIGDANHLVESFHCVFCTAEARPENVPVLISNTVGFWWTEGYLECGSVCFDIPETATTAKVVVITHNFVGGNNTPMLVHAGLSTATVSESGNFVRP